jgi:hypothetical protein
MSFRTLGARFWLLLLPDADVLKARAILAAKQIIVTVLFGIDLRRDSPWMAARMTFKAEDTAEARKDRFTSGGALG